MKRYILLVTIILGCTVAGFSQSENVSFIHGLGSNTSVWNDMAGQLGDEFSFTKNDIGYNTEQDVSYSATSVFIPSGTVSVGHSMGGLLAREYLRIRSTGQMKALITVGTPHYGAPVAVAVQDGKVAEVISGWIEDLAAGPAVSIGSLGGRNFARQILDNLGYVEDATGQKLNALLQEKYGNLPSVDNLKPCSSFLNTLNASPNNTLPSSRYAIFGVEDGPEYVRLAESAVKGEEGSPMKTAHLLIIIEPLHPFIF
ncbi:MAG: hypothetical protein WD016_11755 [Balneolaceae bacterium]